MRNILRKSLHVFLTATSAMLYAADEPLKIADQGIFSSGGITITSDGTFNPEDHWAASGKGLTTRVDHVNVLYQISV